MRSYLLFYSNLLFYANKEHSSGTPEHIPEGGGGLGQMESSYTDLEVWVGSRASKNFIASAIDCRRTPFLNITFKKGFKCVLPYTGCTSHPLYDIAPYQRCGLGQ